MLAVKNIYLLNVTLKEAQMVICACATCWRWGEDQELHLHCYFRRRGARLIIEVNQWNTQSDYVNQLAREKTVRDILPRPGGGNGAWQREMERKGQRKRQRHRDRLWQTDWRDLKCWAGVEQRDLKHGRGPWVCAGEEADENQTMGSENLCDTTQEREERRGGHGTKDSPSREMERSTKNCFSLKRITLYRHNTSLCNKWFSQKDSMCT